MIGMKFFLHKRFNWITGLGLEEISARLQIKIIHFAHIWIPGILRKMHLSPTENESKDF